jgi:hypothetical protein
MTILVFPSTLEAAVKYAADAKLWGQRTIGASSVEEDPNKLCFDSWEQLPFIGDQSFDVELKKVVEKNSVASIYTPHAPTYHLLKDRLTQILPATRLIGLGPFQTQMSRVKENVQIGVEALSQAREYLAQDVALSPQFVGAVIAQAESIHGECSRQKMVALFGVVSNSPPGDIIEIGALFGKSSYLLNRIGAQQKVGAMLAVDPWNLGLSVQLDAPVYIQDASGGWDWDLVATGFLMNMLSASAPPFNYLRLPSADAHKQYTSTKKVSSSEFGETQYSGAISILHLDGNHDEEAVSQDFELWSQHMVRGGWIIFDDYHWPHGDGPKNVANGALEKYGSLVQKHFVAGGALFMKLA